MAPVANAAALEKMKPTGALAEIGDELERNAGAGMEGADKDSFAIPFLAVLQGLSPQCEPVKDGGVEGAKPGLLINTVTNEVMETARIIPVTFRRVYLRWKPRDEGGGFKGEVAVSVVEQLIKDAKAAQDEEGKLMYEGDILSDTRIHYCLLETLAGSWTPVVLSCSRTQVKRSRRFMSLINSMQMANPKSGKMFTPPSYAFTYDVNTVSEENDKGKWYSFDISLHGQLESVDVFRAAQAFHKQITEGKVTVKHDQAARSEERR